MRDAMMKWLAIGLGMAAFSKEKAEELIAELVQRGQLSRDEGREILERLLQQAEQQKAELRQSLSNQMKRLIDTAGLATKAELAALSDRVRVLEERLSGGFGAPGQ